MNRLLTPNSIRLLNVGLRGSTLGARFIFIFFLAKYLDPALIGYYGIFTVTVGYALYFVGLDFYTYVSREIVNASPCQRGRLLKGQAALSGILYLILLPPAVWFLMQAAWPAHLAWWFFPILLFEHLNQEIFRLLVALSEQLTASAILFVRQGSWAVAIILLMGWSDNARNLDMVMTLWATAGAVSASLGIWKLKQLRTSGWKHVIDWAWVKKGIFISLAFLVSTLALRGVQTFDRYWLESLAGIETVGAYVLLFGVASTLLTFLDAAVFSFVYPALIQHAYKCEHREARRKVNLLFLQTIGLSAGFGLISWFLLPYLLTWIGNPIYQQHIHWYPWLLSAIILNGLGLVPHYALYARQCDRSIIINHLSSLPIFCFSTLLFSFKYSAFSVIIGLNVTFAVILLLNTRAYWTIIKKAN